MLRKAGDAVTAQSGLEMKSGVLCARYRIASSYMDFLRGEVRKATFGDFFPGPTP